MRGERTQRPREPDPLSELDKATRASLEALGDRVTSLLRAAEDAAEEIRQMAEQEAEEVRAQAAWYSSEVRRRADAFAAEKQAEAEAEADRVLRASHERAERIEESAVEHRKNVVAETEALQELLDGRRRWLQEMSGAFGDVPGRLEGVDEGSSESDASAALPGQGVEGNTQLDDELRQQAHESAEDAERAKDTAGDKAEDAN